MWTSCLFDSLALEEEKAMYLSIEQQQILAQEQSGNSCPHLWSQGKVSQLQCLNLLYKNLVCIL